MNKLVIFVILISSFSLSASEIFLISERPLSFSEKGKLLLHGCDTKCDALKMIEKHKRISLKDARKGMSFVNSVGSDVCSNVYKAGALMGQASNRDRRAFCVFKDGSMVEMNSLGAYLTEKKIAQ